MKNHRIRDEREFYAAVADYSIKVWEWGAHVDDYLRRRSGPIWFRVIED